MEKSNTIEIQTAEYVASYPKVTACPQDMKPEYAFIGRSNVGKSSLINMLTQRKDLARTSKKPGKTQLINYFLINERFYIVDLPGYGYAKISKKMRAKWEDMISGYLQQRQTLMCAMVLIDSNIPPQKIDLEFVNWLGKMHIPFVLIFTKADRQTNNKLQSNVAAFRKEMLKTWNDMPPQFITSSENGSGRDDVLTFMNEVNEQFYQSL